MKKFKFTLDTVHKVREIHQERESVRLSELQNEAAKAAERVSEIERMGNEAVENYSKRLNCGGQLDPAEMELSSKHFTSLNVMKKEAEVTLAQKQAACHIQVQTVARAMRQVKVTNSLRESQFERHQQEYSRQEQNSVDELVSATFARRILQTK